MGTSLLLRSRSMACVIRSFSKQDGTMLVLVEILPRIQYMDILWILPLYTSMYEETQGRR